MINAIFQVTKKLKTDNYQNQFLFDVYSLKSVFYMILIKKEGVAPLF